MAAGVRSCEGIVEQALDMSKTYREDERTEEELRALFTELKVEMPPKKLKALGRYVSLAKWRHSDSLINNFYSRGSGA